MKFDFTALVFLATLASASSANNKQDTTSGFLRKGVVTRELVSLICDGSGPASRAVPCCADVKPDDCLCEGPDECLSNSCDLSLAGTWGICQNPNSCGGSGIQCPSNTQCFGDDSTCLASTMRMEIKRAGNFDCDATEFAGEVVCEMDDGIFVPNEGPKLFSGDWTVLTWSHPCKKLRVSLNCGSIPQRFTPLNGAVIAPGPPAGGNAEITALAGTASIQGLPLSPNELWIQPGEENLDSFCLRFSDSTGNQVKLKSDCNQ